MTADVKTCDYCKKPIPQEEFDMSRAVKILGRNYCSDCAADAIRKSKSESFVPNWRTPRPTELNPRPSEPSGPEPDPGR